MPTVNRQAIANAEQVQGRNNLALISKAFRTSVSAQTVTQWTATGIPGTGVNTGGVAYTGAQLTSATTGALAFGDAPASHKRFLRSIQLCTNATTDGVITVLDRLVQFPGIDHATIGTTGIVYDPGLPRYTTGAGVMAFLEVTTGLNAVAHTISISYTNQAGTSGRTSVAITPTASAGADRVPHLPIYLPFQSGDTGIKNVASVTIASAGAPTGTSCLVLAKPICHIHIAGDRNALEKGSSDFLNLNFDLPEIQNGAALMMLFTAQTSIANPAFRGHAKSFVVQTS